MKHTDTNTEIIQKLTEVLNILKAKEEEKCPLRKMMSSEEFEKISKDKCEKCPFFLKKNQKDDSKDDSKDDIEKENEEFIDKPENKPEHKTEHKAEHKQCQLLNSISIFLLVLLAILLVRVIKGFYCTV